MLKAVVSAVALALGAAGGAWALFQERLPAAPMQPLRFSHRIHAGKAGIGCTSCHVYAARSPVAGVPSMARCNGCHRWVKSDPTDPSLDAELRALAARLSDPMPIAWVRVHRLPDHVYFTHERHIHAGVACRACHGEVERMELVRQVAPLSMGWCLECHRRAQSERPARRAHLTECWTCHK